jgi:hypothetical protein
VNDAHVGYEMEWMEFDDKEFEDALRRRLPRIIICKLNIFGVEKAFSSDGLVQMACCF